MIEGQLWTDGSMGRPRLDCCIPSCVSTSQVEKLAVQMLLLTDDCVTCRIGPYLYIHWRDFTFMLRGLFSEDYSERGSEGQMESSCHRATGCESRKLGTSDSMTADPWSLSLLSSDSPSTTKVSTTQIASWQPGIDAGDLGQKRLQNCLLRHNGGALASFWTMQIHRAPTCRHVARIILSLRKKVHLYPFHIFCPIAALRILRRILFHLSWTSSVVKAAFYAVTVTPAVRADHLLLVSYSASFGPSSFFIQHYRASA